jgi:oligopeptide transport system substrate-binding protein
MWMATAQPSWVVEEFGDQWTEDSNIVSYGPFALQSWVHDDSLTIVRNPFWPGTDTIPVPTLDAVVGTMLEAEAALANYEADLLDVAAVPSADFDRVVADPVLSEEYTTGPGSCTYNYVYNTSVAPFDDVRVRRAFSMALNRQEIIDNVLKAGQEPAFFFSRPNLVAAPLQDELPDFVIGEDDELARELINEYIAENGELPTITASHNESSGHAAIMAAAVEMWRTTLGVEDIQITTQEWATYLETIKNDDTAPGVFRYAWCLDYPDTHNFLFDVFHSSTIELGTSWTNPEFDALLEEAKAETDTAVRQELYAEAEYILTVEDAVIAPIYYYTSSRLTKPYVERPYGGLGNTYYENWSVAR